MAITPHADDRRCATPGCTTILCTYNTETTCYIHTRQAEQADLPVVPRIHKERVAYDHLMKQLGHGERIAA